MFRSFKEALYHSCEHGFLEIAMELRSLGKNELCITFKSVFRLSIIKAKKTSKKIYLKGQGDRVIQSEDNENMKWTFHEVALLVHCFQVKLILGMLKFFGGWETGGPIYISQNPPSFSICLAQVCHGTSIVGVKL